MATSGFGPINTGQSGLTGLLGGISTGADEFFRAAQGMLALENARREQTMQHGSDLLQLYGRAAQGNPALLDDPTFQSHVTQIASKLGLPAGGAGLPGTGNEVAGLLGMPTLQDILAKPGVLGSIEESPEGPGRSAAAEVLLGRQITPQQTSQLQALPEQYPPAQQAAITNALERDRSSAEKTAATQANPTALLEFYRSRQPIFEKLYGKDMSNQMIDSALSSNLGQMTATQLSALSKNQAYTQYLKDRGIEINTLLDAKKKELLSRSVAEQARAAYSTAQTSLIPARAKNLYAMAGYYDGRSENEHWQAQQTREAVQTYLQTGMMPGDISKTRADYMTLISKNRQLIANLQKQINTAKAAGEDDSTIKPIQQQLDAERQVQQGDEAALNALNSRFAKGVLPQMSGGESPQGASDFGPAASAEKIDVANPPPGTQYSASRQQYRTPDGTIYDSAGNLVSQP